MGQIDKERGSITYLGERHFQESLSLDDVVRYLNSPQNFLTFSVSLRRLLAEEGLDAGAMRNMDVVNHIFAKFDAKGIDYTTNTVRDWIHLNIRPEEEYALKLCFAFDCFAGAPDRAGTFLMKDCILDGFSPRDPAHILYRHGLARAYSWRRTRGLIEQFFSEIRGRAPAAEPDPVPGDRSADSEILMLAFFSDASAQMDDRVLLDNLADCYAEGKFGRYRKTAFELYADLKQGLLISLMDSHPYVRDDGDELNMPYKKLLDHLFPRPRHDAGKDPVRYKDLRLPREVYRNLPNNMDLGNIDRQRVSVNRKTLVLMHFAAFFAELRNLDARKRVDQFRTRMNDMLLQCGMLELYPGNPFDWMILKSVYDDDPNAFLTDLIDYAYEVNQSRG